MMGPWLRACIVALVLCASCASEPPAADAVARGARVYRALDCGSCHDPRLGGLFRASGPPLDHAGTSAAARKTGMSAEDYLRESVTTPGAYVVPGYTDSMPRGLVQRISPADVDALIQYLSSLK